jgi:hypothetical protein
MSDAGKTSPTLVYLEDTVEGAIDRCPRCLGSHQGVPLKRLPNARTQLGEGSHFIMCPATDAPVIVELDQPLHYTETYGAPATLARGSLLGQLSRSSRQGRHGTRP